MARLEQAFYLNGAADSRNVCVKAIVQGAQPATGQALYGQSGRNIAEETVHKKMLTSNVWTKPSESRNDSARIQKRIRHCTISKKCLTNIPNLKLFHADEQGQEREQKTTAINVLKHNAEVVTNQQLEVLGTTSTQTDTDTQTDAHTNTTNRNTYSIYTAFILSVLFPQSIHV